MERKKVDVKPKAKPKPQPPPKTKKKSEEEEEDNIYSGLSIDDEEYDVDDDTSDEDDDLDSETDEGYKDPSMFQKYKVVIIIAVVGLIIGAIVIFLTSKEEEVPIAVETVVEDEVDPSLQAREDLYQLGIGKETLNEAKIYQQGNLSSEDFRKDFLNTGTGETYKEPVEINTVNDSVAYTKYRTMTDDGIDVYWVDAVYKEKKTALTVPYYIWRTLAPQGVMDVVVEVITDADEKVFIGSITAKPPSEGGTE